MPARPPLLGTYRAPAVKRGERVTCLYRDTDCRVTSWTDAPILNGPTLTRRIRRRSYILFFNRSHLHMVGFKENGAAYWVVNTLLDRMSNETMLAIAQGMKPAGAP